MDYIKCKKCKGSGRVTYADGMKITFCSDCNGYGKVKKPEPKENYGMCINCKELIPLSKVASIEKTRDYICLECIEKMKEQER